MKFRLLILGLLFWGGLLSAQADLSAHLLRGSWQAYATNPALLPTGRITLGLPGFYNNLLVTNITFNDLLATDANGATVLDVDAAIAQLGDRNTLRENLDLETLGLAVRLGPLALSLGHRLRFNALLDYPKTLPQLIWQGNAQFLGQTVGFGSDLDLTAYHELALGVGLDLGPRLTVGGRAKLLSGAAAVATERSRLELTTSEEGYELELDADFQVNTANALTYDSFRDIGVDFDFGRFDGASLFSANSGLAFDLGVAYRTDRLELTASALDLGGVINWDDNARNYSLLGQYDFAGLDVAQGILDDSTEFANVLDTLEALYDFTETQEAFSSTVGSKFYLSGRYQLTTRWAVGALVFLENYRDELDPAIALTADWQPLPALRLGALVGWRNEQIDNIGLNATVALGPVWLVAATDNVLTAFRPKDSHTANVRLGLNLMLGQPAEKTGRQSSFF